MIALGVHSCKRTTTVEMRVMGFEPDQSWLQKMMKKEKMYVVVLGRPYLIRL